MILIVLLITLFVQRVLPVDSYGKHHHWFAWYYNWLKNRLSHAVAWNNFVGVAIILLPAFVSFVLLVSVVYFVIGKVGYYILTLVVVWYCLDSKALTRVNDQASVKTLLQQSYERIFAITFWLLLLGMIGVVLYVLVSSLRHHLASHKQTTNEQEWLLAARNVQGVLDWIPLRLLGLTYALVGQFNSAFKIWWHNLLTDIKQANEQMVVCGLAALNITGDPNQIPSSEQLKSMQSLIMRCMLIWLVVIALFIIGRWFG